MDLTTRQGRILVMDDKEAWRDELARTLLRSGFLVDTAAIVEQAQELLSKNFYHLLVLDLRMDETDQTNEDGIKLLDELEKLALSDATKVIMLSAHGTKEQMRTVFRAYRVAEFLFKDEFNNLAFLECVHHVFSDDIKINLQLDINWQVPYRPEQIVLNLAIDGISIENVSSRYLIEAELDDLLCRLFYQADSLLVRSLTIGYSGIGILWVHPFYSSTGAGRAVIVKIGNWAEIAVEYQKFQAYMAPLLGGGRSVTILAARRTYHLGGIVYSLLGASDDDLEDFGTFYRRVSISQIKNVLDRLFLSTCANWYANLSALHPINLTEDYQNLFGFTWEQLKQSIPNQLKSVQDKDTLAFKFLESEHVFINPILVAEGKSLIRPTYTCITHGNFNQHNILIDRVGQTWMIDFQKTDRGHLLRDVASLETIIRIQLLGAEEATLQERLLMEEALCSIDSFDQIEQLDTFATENRDLTKVFATIVHLRMIARRLLTQKLVTLDEYYIALFYNALSMLRSDTLSIRQREHALLSASLLATRLSL